MDALRQSQNGLSSDRHIREQIDAWRQQIRHAQQQIDRLTAQITSAQGRKIKLIDPRKRRAK